MSNPLLNSLQQNILLKLQKLDETVQKISKTCEQNNKKFDSLEEKLQNLEYKANLTNKTIERFREECIEIASALAEYLEQKPYSL